MTIEQLEARIKQELTYPHWGRNERYILELVLKWIHESGDKKA